MKSIAERVTTSLKPEFEKNVEKIRNDLRKCLLPMDMSHHEKQECRRESDHLVNKLYLKYVSKGLNFA